MRLKTKTLGLTGWTGPLADLNLIGTGWQQTRDEERSEYNILYNWVYFYLFIFILATYENDGTA